MVRFRLVGVWLGLAAACAGATFAMATELGARTPHHPPLSRAQARAAYGRLPLSFEKNRGQAPTEFDYVAHGAGYALGLGRSGVELALTRGKHRSAGLEIRTPGGQLRSPVASRPLPGKANYFIGNDRAKWVTGAPTFGRIVYRNVWPGVDLAFHGHQGTFEYDLDLAAGANPSNVALRFAGAKSVTADGQGGARIELAGGSPLRIPAPRASQGGRRVASRLVVSGRAVHLALGAYDRSRPLIVDPDLVYSTYLGGNAAADGLAIAVDTSGNAYITGVTTGSFPTTVGAYQTTFGGGGDAFVSKLNTTGTLTYSTYLGGSAGDAGLAVAVDASGNAYITGDTRGSFPTTVGAYQTTFGGGDDAFLSKLDATGSTLSYSTYLGGSGDDQGLAVAVDASGNAYITGFASASFPTTVGAYQTTYGGDFDDAFVSKVSSDGTTLTYSTYIGGSGNDVGHGIAVDTSGKAYITGDTTGSFPTTAGAHQTTYGGGDNDAFVSKLSATGSTLSYSTYLGGGGNDEGQGIAVDTSGYAYITGDTAGLFPTTVGAHQTTYGGGEFDAFVSKLNPIGTTLTYSTYLGGSTKDQGLALAVDASGSAYITGLTGGSYPTTAGAYQTAYGGGSDDAFISKLNSTGTALAYSSYLGGGGDDVGRGIALDAIGNAYVTGVTTGSFPTTSGGPHQAGSPLRDYPFVSKVAVPPPDCQTLHQTVSHNSAIMLVLPCSDANAQLTSLSVLSVPAHGTIGTPDPATGEVSYVPHVGFSGIDSFTYRASSPNGRTSVRTAYLSVEPAPPPTCSDAALSVNENTPAKLVLLCSADRDPLKLSVTARPHHGKLGKLSGDTIKYTPNHGYTGPDTVAFRVTDTADSQTSAPATYYLTVVPQQRGPRGKRGPAGRAELVTCKKVKKKTKCTARSVSGLVKFKTSSSVRAFLRRDGILYATGPAKGNRMLLSPLRRLTKGRYTLTIKRGNKVLSRRTITIG